MAWIPGTHWDGAPTLGKLQLWRERERERERDREREGETERERERERERKPVSKVMKCLKPLLWYVGGTWPRC